MDAPKVPLAPRALERFNLLNGGFHTKLQRLAAAAGLSLVTIGASAVTHQMGDMTSTGGFSFASEAKDLAFSDRWDFSVTQQSQLTFSVVNSFVAPEHGLLRLDVIFSGIGFGNVQFFHFGLGPNANGWATTKVGSLGAGSRSIAVEGDPVPGSKGFYSGVASIRPVPEPGTYALLVLGLSAVGLVAVRRKR